MPPESLTELVGVSHLRQLLDLLRAAIGWPVALLDREGEVLAQSGEGAAALDARRALPIRVADEVAALLVVDAPREPSDDAPLDPAAAATCDSFVAMVEALAEANRAAHETTRRCEALRRVTCGGLMVEHRERGIIEANDRAGEILGLGREQLLGLSSFRPTAPLLREDGRPFDVDDLPTATTFRNGQPARDVVVGFTHATDGAARWVQVNCEPLGRGPDGRVETILVAFTHVTSTRQAEEAVRTAYQFNEEIISNAGTGIVVLDRNLRFVLWNAYMEAKVGMMAAEVLGRPALSVFPRLLAPGFREIAERVMGGEVCHTPDIRYDTPAGSDGWLVGTFAPHRNTRGEIVGIVVALLDVTERKWLETELFESRETAWALLNASDDVAALFDRDYRVIAVNEAMARRFGRSPEELVGVSPHDVLPPDVARSRHERFNEAVASGEPLRHEDERDGRAFANTIFPIADASGRVTRVALFARDITHLRRAEEAQRLAALGQLAGGVAHEFNNLMCSLWLNADLADTRGDVSGYQAFCELTREAARRGGAICADLMSFARPSPPRLELLAPERPLEAALAVAARQLTNSEVVVERLYNAGGLVINGDAGQLQQVYLNIIINACQAMPRGGVLTCAIDGEDGPGGREVVVRVRDTGEGVLPEDLPRLFEPFFTTKGGLGQSEVPGTGLGLSVSHALVTAQGGTIAAYSQWSAGATFELRFPALEASAVAPGAAAASVGGGGDWRAPGWRVLLAEDESNLREAVVQALTERGMEVVAAASAPEAVAALRRATFGLVITDLLMPGGGGMEVLAAATALPTAPRLLVITGKVGDGLVEGLRAAGAEAVLHKPFGAADILAAVQRLLPET